MPSRYDRQTGDIKPVVTIVTDNGGPFRSFRSRPFITAHPEFHHVRTRVKSPGQNGSLKRGVGTLKYKRLYMDEIEDAVILAKHTEDYRIEYNEVRPHDAIAWNRPKEVHLRLADPTMPTFQAKEVPCQLLDAGPHHVCGGGVLSTNVVEQREERPTGLSLHTATGQTCCTGEAWRSGGVAGWASRVVGWHGEIEQVRMGRTAGAVTAPVSGVSRPLVGD